MGKLQRKHEAAVTSQNITRPNPLVESRVFYKNEIAHWEFDSWEVT
ncbi:hypothetical protein [Halobacillus campisalis]